MRERKRRRGGGAVRALSSPLSSPLLLYLSKQRRLLLHRRLVARYRHRHGLGQEAVNLGGVQQVDALAGSRGGVAEGEEGGRAGQRERCAHGQKGEPGLPVRVFGEGCGFVRCWQES